VPERTEGQISNHAGKKLRQKAEHERKEAEKAKEKAILDQGKDKLGGDVGL
jgi:hypothetical protein